MLSIVFGIIFGPFWAARDGAKIQRVRAQVAETLGVLAEPESVEALTSAALEVSSRVNQPAQEALVKVLPKVTEEWRGRVSANAIHGLCNLLPEAGGHLAVEILHALERIGPGSAADSVAWAVHVWADGPVRREAERILVVLRERQRTEKESARLLRAAIDSGDAALLRASPKAAEEDSAELLRPLDSAG